MAHAEFTVPGEPKGKGRVRVTRTGHAYTPKDTEIYENLVRHSFTNRYPDFVPIEGELTAVITAVYSVPKSVSNKRRQMMLDKRIRPTKKPDVDNITKSVLDSLNGIAYKDDSQVTGLEIMKEYGEIPMVRVIIFWGED